MTATMRSIRVFGLCLAGCQFVSGGSDLYELPPLSAPECDGTCPPSCTDATSVTHACVEGLCTVLELNDCAPFGCNEATGLCDDGCVDSSGCPAGTYCDGVCLVRAKWSRLLKANDGLIWGSDVDDLGNLIVSGTFKTSLVVPPRGNLEIDTNKPHGFMVTLDGASGDGSDLLEFGDNDNTSILTPDVSIVGEARTVSMLFNGNVTIAGENHTKVGLDHGLIVATFDGPEATDSVDFKQLDLPLGAVNHTSDDGSVFITGFGPGTWNLGGDLIGTASTNSAFVARYSSSLEHVWSAAYGSVDGFFVYRMAVSDDGNRILLAGQTHNDVNLGGGVLEKAGDFDGWFLAVDGQGAHQKSVIITGPDKVLASDVTLADDGRYAVAGTFLETATIGQTTLSSTGDFDAYVAVFDQNDDLTFAKALGGIFADNLHDIAFDRDGNLMVLGKYVDEITFGATTLSSVGGDDVFIVSISPSGEFSWSASYGTGEDESLLSLVPSGDDVFIMGTTGNGSIEFGTTTHSATKGDLFVARLSSL